jgi:hypothetical protein
LCKKLPVTTLLGAGVRELRAIAGQGRLGLLQLRFERAWIESKQQIAFLHEIPIAHCGLDDLAVYPRLDRDACVWLDIADRPNLNRHRLLSDGGRTDRHCFTPRRLGRLGIGATEQDQSKRKKYVGLTAKR